MPFPNTIIDCSSGTSPLNRHIYRRQPRQYWSLRILVSNTITEVARRWLIQIPSRISIKSPIPSSFKPIKSIFAMGVAKVLIVSRIKKPFEKWGLFCRNVFNLLSHIAKVEVSNSSKKIIRSQLREEIWDSHVYQWKKDARPVFVVSFSPAVRNGERRETSFPAFFVIFRDFDRSGQ